MRNLYNVTHCKDYWRLASFSSLWSLIISLIDWNHIQSKLWHQPPNIQVPFHLSSPWDFLSLSLLLQVSNPFKEDPFQMSWLMTFPPCCYLSAPWSLAQPVSSFCTLVLILELGGPSQKEMGSNNCSLLIRVEETLIH